jgi:anti-sigma factor RsiW
MDCKKTEHKIGAYINGTLEKDEHKQVEGHISQCTDCMKLYNFMKETMGIIDVERNIGPKPFLYTRIQARQAAYRPMPTNWRAASVFATLVLLIGIVIGTAIGRATIPDNEQETQYTVAYLFDDTNIESLEKTLLNDETE